jgi:hypothetical protein
MSANIATVRRYGELLQQKLELDGKLKQVESKLKDLEAGVLDYFIDQGVDSIKLEGITLSTKRLLVPKYVDEHGSADAVRALLLAGMHDLVPHTLSHQRLGSLLRERRDHGETPVPKALEGIVEAVEMISIGYRRR